MLLYADEHFTQTLEGDEEQVDTAFDRIGADPRHRDVEVALRETVTERSLDGWKTGFRRLSTEEAARIPGCSEFLEPRSQQYKDTKSLGRASGFYRAFRQFRAPRGGQ